MQTGENGSPYTQSAHPAQPSAMSPPTDSGFDFATNQPSPTSPEQRKASHSTSHGLNARSCITCRRRKVKCDKQVPCSNCTKAGTECVFPAPGRAPRRPRQAGKVVSEREVELLKRLRRLEGVVEELSGQVELEAVKQSPSSDNSSGHRDGDSTGSSTKPHNVRVVGMDEGTKKQWMARNFRIGSGPPKTAFNLDVATQGIGKLVLDEGKSQYVASPFWASITDEVEEIKEMLDDQEFDSDSDAPIVPTADITEPDHQSFLMGYSSSDVNLKPLHPLPSQISFYWQTFLENVQPLTKLMHAPTMNKVIKEVQANLDFLSPSTEALMFSIYFATITSMSGVEVRTNLGVGKDVLIKQYRFAVEQALARAGFLNTNEIVTVQAFILFLVCVRRHDDTRFVWSLTGLALRIAQSLGLHRDGTKFGLSPFDTEMRRRLWWQVCILDVRASEDHGSDPSIMDFSFDTEYPLSVNDDDLSPELTEFPVVRPGVSEMTFCLIRYEICSLSRKLTYIPPGSCRLKGPSPLTIDEKEALVKESAIILEDKYLKYCEDAGPLYWVAATVARLIIAKMNLIIYHPLTQPGKLSILSQSIRDRLFMSSIQIIEYSRVLESEATTKQWGWLFHTYIQWHAIAHILGELAERNNSVIVDRAWRAMDSIFNDWGGLDPSKSGMLWQPMRKLMVKARRKREENRQMHSSTELGIDSRYNRPAPEGLVVPRPCPITIPQDRLAHMIASPTKDNPMTTVMSSSTAIYPMDNSAMIEPQVIGMGMLAPEQVQMQIEQQAGQQSTSWMMDDNTLLDMDMNGLDGDTSWNGWEDLVRDFQLETDNQMRDTDMGRGPTLGGLGSWW